MALKILSEFLSCNKKGCKIIRNKCFIVFLIIFLILISAVIGAKLWINSILNELEQDSLHLNGTLLERVMTTGSDGNEKVDADQILKQFMDHWLTMPEDIRKGGSSTLSGFDFQNRPVWILPVGRWDVKGMLNSKDENEKLLKEYTDRGLLNMYMSMKLRNANQMVIICDMDQYSYGQLASIKTIKFFIQMGKKYQPLFEHLAYGFTVNLDTFSRALVAIMQPIMGHESMDRIDYFGRDKDKYVDAILKKIPATQLPPQYGGSKDYKPLGFYD